MEENAINKCSKRVLNGFAIVSMSIRYRPLRPKDVRKCVELVAAHPILAPRYGRVIEQLPSAILNTLGRDCMVAIAFEEFEQKHDEIPRRLPGRVRVRRFPLPGEDGA